MAFTVIAVFAVACSEDKPSAPAKKYTLTFMLDENTVFDSYTGVAGSDVVRKEEEPSDATRRFEGWSQTPNGEVEEVPTKMPAEDRTYYAIFVRYYNIELKVGVGSYSGATTLSTKSNQNLYSLVKNISPKGPDDSTFDGWYYNNAKLDAKSNAVMPEKNIILEAKYSVGYAVNVHVQKKFGGEETDDSKSSGTGLVGDKLPSKEYAAKEGYELDEEKSKLTIVLKSKKDENNYNIYYNKIGYNVTFVANAPDGTTASGDSLVQEWGHGETYAMPKCSYTINGYRFSYWATDPDGKNKFYVGDEYSVQSTTLIYAIWVRGLSDASGFSSDRIFIDKTKDQKVVAYLSRAYAKELVGTFNEKTNIFEFKQDDKTVLTGVAYLKDYRFVYFRDKYTLRVNGTTSDSYYNTLNNDVTLEISKNGNSAVYDNGTTKVNGTYAFDSDASSLKFESKDTSFYFRISKTIDDNGIPVDIFEIRGEEYGIWYNMDALGNISLIAIASSYYYKYRLFLDGYGGAQMIAVGYNSVYSTSPKAVSSTTNGIYRFTEDSTKEKPEISVLISNGTYSTSFNCLLLEIGEEATDKVYLEKYNLVEAYKKPAEDAELDIDTADKIVLDGYGYFDNSAVITSGSSTVEGKYYFDKATGQLRVMPKNGTEVTYELSGYKMDDETIVNVYEETDKVFYGDYAVTGLSKQFNPGAGYFLRVYNNGRADLMLYMPFQHNIYGNSYFDYGAIASGVCVALENEEYHFIGSINYSAYSAAYLYMLLRYYAIIDVTSFPNFKFKVNGPHAGASTGIGDGYEDYSIVYNGVEYITDGFGKAIAKNDAKDVKTYTVGVNGGVYILTLKWDEKDKDGKDVTKTQRYYKIDDQFKKFDKAYLSYNTGNIYLYMYVVEGDYAVLGYYNGSNVAFFEIGSVSWNDSAHKYGTYTRDSLTDESLKVLQSYFAPVFKFVTDDPAEKSDFYKLYMYNSGSAPADDKSTINGENGAKIIIDHKTHEAEYITSDGKSVKSKYSFNNDIINITDKSGKEAKTLSFKLLYNEQNTAIETFIIVDRFSGTWQNYSNANKYMVLTGELDSKSKQYIGYYVAVGEDDEQVKIAGTYISTDNEDYSEIKFTYDNDGTTEVMYFIVGFATKTNLPIYITSTLKLDNWKVYASLNKTGDGEHIGVLSGGGYDAQTYTPNGKDAISGGVLEYINESKLYKDYKLYRFIYADASSAFYFLLSKDNKAFMLDGTFMPGSYGKFDCTDPFTITIPETASKAEQKITVTSILLDGMGTAYLTATDGKEYTVIYGAYSNTIFQLGAPNKDGVNVRLIIFKLYSNSTEGTYTCVAQDLDMSYDVYMGSFSGDGLSMLLTDGFSAAYYIDEDGRVYAGTYVRLSENPEVVAFLYADLVYKVMYFEIDTEKGTFKHIGYDDSRIPEPDDGSDDDDIVVPPQTEDDEDETVPDDDE